MSTRIHAQQRRYRAFGKWQRLLDRRFDKSRQEPGGKGQGRSRQSVRG